MLSDMGDICLDMSEKHTNTDIDINSVLNEKIFKHRQQYYSSNVNGTHISNAKTGEIYGDMVGTHAEKKYFRVIDATGNVNDKGMRAVGVKNPNKLFYKNVGEYLTTRNRKFDIKNTIGSERLG